MKFRFLIAALAIVLVTLVPIGSKAQAPLPGDPADNPSEPAPLPPDPADVPIDGGLSILLAAGVGYGAKKLNDKRKKKLLEAEK